MKRVFSNQPVTATTENEIREHVANYIELLLENRVEDGLVMILHERVKDYDADYAPDGVIDDVEAKLKTARAAYIKALTDGLMYNYKEV